MSSWVTHAGRARSVEAILQHRFAVWALAAIAFADSSLLPVPPDFLFVPLALVRPKQIGSLSLICIVAASLGAIVGYTIGYGFWSLVGERLVELCGYSEGFARYRRLVEEWGVWIIIAKAFTPVPFKIMAIAAGVSAMNPVAFMGATIIGRALHFAMLAALVRVFGDQFRLLLTSYERPLLVISALVLVAVAVAYYLR
jgi:membrane protein YqaA with SNARE-associated domain